MFTEQENNTVKPVDLKKKKEKQKLVRNCQV